MLLPAILFFGAIMIAQSRTRKTAASAGLSSGPSVEFGDLCGHVRINDAEAALDEFEDALEAAYRAGLETPEDALAHWYDVYAPACAQVLDVGFQFREQVALYLIFLDRAIDTINAMGLMTEGELDEAFDRFYTYLETYGLTVEELQDYAVNLVRQPDMDAVAA